MHFNGTAGIWRKKCIEEAGGWEIDTLTEDIDLSYRAQLQGWQLTYVDSVGAPAELPILMSAVKSQQFRWMKGGAEVARKMLKKVWKSDWSLAAKWHSTHHLLGSSLFLLSLTLGILSGPISYFAFIFPRNDRSGMCSRTSKSATRSQFCERASSHSTKVQCAGIG